MLTTDRVLERLIGDTEAAAEGTYSFTLAALRGAAQVITIDAEADKAEALAKAFTIWEGIEEKHVAVRTELEKGLADMCEYVRSIPKGQRNDALETIWEMAEATLAIACVKGRKADEPTE
jgi:hypothetical protein